MMFSGLFLLFCVLTVSSFSNQALGSTKALINANCISLNVEPIDKSMKGIDEAGSFDPTVGDNCALQRNNEDEVWVAQVC